MPLALPDFPWDSLLPYRATAGAHSDGIVDLAIGSPVDPVPELIRDALAAAVDSPGYPQTQGSPEVRAAIVGWYARRGVEIDPPNAIPTIGSKEFIATLPTLLGLGPGDVVVVPTVAYPTYEVGARIAGAEVLRSDEPDEWPTTTRLIWLNSPGNPDGKVHGHEFLRRAVVRARDLGAVVANDECYTELNWDGAEPTPSILDPEVTQGSRRLTLAVHSLSKRSNLAGYRAGFVAGCSDLVGEILEARKHAGLIPPAPVQHAMAVALGDDEHVLTQKARYGARRDQLATALTDAGFRIDESRAGLYLWATRGEDCWATVGAFAELGILVTPGSFYGDAGREHVRISLTATDERVAAAARRLASSSN
ncbi:succinyldiaminopimelate transaminase [Pseudolysinimonas yzui]|uniref:Aminotransferase n=1 Tax=Pseudolysinimonas yzui TaxID=2708254 RepID=A0A8J3GRD8_9MICO|nr:succinyldiaminopimelate transaminase [Pseudolysinimonas yzui]GHF18053.1 succinyldiaminopimelate transaminase [Pseudolysinimonas yzui]